MDPIRRIAIVEPAAAGIHVFSRAGLPRLGCVLLGTMLRDEGYEVSVQAEELRPIDEAPLLEADVVGISVITSTATNCYDLADTMRGHGKTVVLGGPHVTWRADEALEHADYVIRGEGEQPLSLLLKQLATAEPDLASVPGLSWRDSGGEVHHNPLATPVDMDSLPTPDLDLVGCGQSKAMGPRRVIPIQTSRGCPFSCTFCTVHSTFGRHVRYRSIPRILEDLDAVDGNDVHVFFYDDIFVVNRTRSAELSQKMIDRGYGLKYSAQVRADLGKDPELLKLMKRSGCMGVYIGLESVNEAALSGMQKRQSVEAMSENIHRIREAGINVHGMFVLGFDEDDASTVQATVDFATRCGVTSVQFMLLTPLPGSQTFNQLKEQGRLLTMDWGLYDSQHVVFAPKLMSPAELQTAQVEGHKSFYSAGRILRYAARGDLLNSAIAVYARKLNRDWTRQNRGYIDALDRIDGEAAPGAFDAAFDLVPRRPLRTPSHAYQRNAT